MSVTLKIECPCGARYSFDVEPQNGRMPSAVQCPVCRADGTAAANNLIAAMAAEAAPRLRIHDAPPQEPEAAPAESEGVPETEAGPIHNVPRMDFSARRAAEEAATRKSAWITGTVAALVLLVLGAWGWYAFFGSKPHLAAWLKMTGAGASEVRFLGPDKILVVTAGEAALRDSSLKNVIWSTKLGDARLDPPRVVVTGSLVWICLGSRVECLDWNTGNIKQTIPIEGNFVSFSEGGVFHSPEDVSLLVVSAPDETRRITLRININSGEVARREISVPRKEKQTLPDDLPPNVAPTAGVLVSQALDEQKFNRPLDAMSSEFFSAGVNLVELRVKLLEAKVDYVQSIKPSGPSELNGQTTTSTSSSLVVEQLFNDIKRSQTGGVRRVDHSRYQVRLRRWTAEEPVEWTGEVTGAPSFFPLRTVDLLTAGNVLMVFDKENTKLFESKLTYPVADRFVGANENDRLMPAAERDNTLYFFDQGVLTAFALPSGEVRWRLTSFGVGVIQFDDQGMLYVDSTTAGPEDIQYADTVRIEKIHPVLLKVDPASGKILWKAEQRGEQSLISGKYLYASATEEGGLGIANALGEAVNAPKNESVYFHLYRLDPSSGEAMWDLSQNQRPENLAVLDNRILIRFGDDLELFKYLSW